MKYISLVRKRQDLWRKELVSETCLVAVVLIVGANKLSII